ncbi:hypothetical protein GYMLUDRAFT_51084, partial [Collybiopsis luxurians FD-317 M1]
MSSPEQNIPASATHYSGDYFSGASNFTIRGNVNINGAAKPKENAVATAPAGFTAGMTDLSPVSPFFTGRKIILSELETYFSVESFS